MGFWEKCLLNKMKDVDGKNLNYKEEIFFRKCNILIWISKIKKITKIYSKN